MLPGADPDRDTGAIAARSSDLFRFEAQPTYLVEQETDDFAAWRRGDRTLRTPETNSWLAHIRDTTAVGARWSRVRILDYPLTEYSEFELHGYQANHLAGEQIYVADRAWSPELDGLREDFWVFDSTVVCMIYGQGGHFLRPELANDPSPFNGMRSVGLRHSVPLVDYLADTPEHGYGRFYGRTPGRRTSLLHSPRSLTYHGNQLLARISARAQHPQQLRGARPGRHPERHQIPVSVTGQPS